MEQNLITEYECSEEELKVMWSQIVTSSRLEDNKYRSKKYMSYKFREVFKKLILIPMLLT